MTVTKQGTSSPFPLLFPQFPVTQAFMEPPDNKIRVQVLENSRGMCPTILRWFKVIFSKNIIGAGSLYVALCAWLQKPRNFKYPDIGTSTLMRDYRVWVTTFHSGPSQNRHSWENQLLWTLNWGRTKDLFQETRQTCPQSPKIK